MTKNKQKIRELEQLKKAFNLLGIRSYEILENNESPDFIVKINDQNIGVEVTEIYRELDRGKSSKTESDLPKIVEESINIYNNKKGKPFSFGFGFNGNVAVNNRRDISRNIGEFLLEQSNKISNKYHCFYKFIPDKNKYPSLHIIKFICAQGTQGIDNKNSVGFVTSVFDSIQVEHSSLESAIHKKNSLVPRYRQRCDVIWLLITLPTMNLSGDLTLPDKEFTSQYTSFNAIYLLDDYRDEIKCINQGR